MTQSANIPTPGSPVQGDPDAWKGLELAKGWTSLDWVAQYRIVDWKSTNILEMRGAVTATQEFPYWFTIGTLPVAAPTSRRQPATYTNEVKSGMWLCDTWHLFVEGARTGVYGTYSMGIRIGGMLNLDGVSLVWDANAPGST